MSPRAFDMLDDSFPHGTVDGHRQGCRSSQCPAVIPCRDVHRRYQGDYGFRKLIDAGVTVEEIARRETEAAEPVAQPKRAAVARPVPAPPKVKPADTVRPLSPEARAAGEVAIATTEETAVPAGPKWRIRHVWVAFDPRGKMHGPFEAQPEALTFVGAKLRPTTASASRIPMTADEVAKIRELWSLNYSDGEIARRLGRSQGAVSRQRRGMGLEAHAKFGGRTTL